MVDRRRQWRAENQDIHIKKKIGDTNFIVNGNRGIDYQVDLTGPSCSCPDWKKHQPDGGCKHILRVKLAEEAIEPLPSALTNFGSQGTRSTNSYPENWDELSQRVKKRDNWVCQKCAAKGGPSGNARVEAHHIIPKSKGGGDRLSNLITLCHDCHESEHGHRIPTSTDRPSYGHSSGTQILPDTGETRSPPTSTRHTGSESTVASITDQQNVTPEQESTSAPQAWWHFVALADLHIPPYENTRPWGNTYRLSKSDFGDTESTAVSTTSDSMFSQEADTRASESTPPEERETELFEFTGEVVLPGDPLLIDDGEQTYVVPLGSSISINDSITTPGEAVTVIGSKIDKNTIIAKDIKKLPTF
ncbi:SWIM zinc finger family protein [Halorubrum vacuolatum]|uniref:SWIM zinc finger n=1 Tax=Halorubrum vacuolatum TaxID=63740 RepID=A0A238YAH5_HALVU|nr:SWIM zinc finger family protein [Halorubrum vacuolatum]SNR68266.1 SWIM zinc finger [Halorubrum vacuolatum]